MSLNTLNLKQKQGGRVIKQADYSSTFKFALQDSKGALINLNGQEASISLFNPNIKKYWSTKAKVKDDEVEFKLPGNIEENDYVLEITVGGYVFPSDNDFIIEVVKGFRDLPDMETGLRYKQSIEEITDDYIKRSDNKLKENLDDITSERNKIDTANAEILKNITDTGKKYISDIDTNYTNAKKDFDTNASQKNQDLKTNYDTYYKSLTDETIYGTQEIDNKTDNFNTNYQAKVATINQKSDDVISLIGSKKEELLQEVDGQVKTSADKYMGEIKNTLNNKVDKIDGKVLSDNNYTNEDKEKVGLINDKVDKVAGKDLSDNNYTNQDKEKLDKLDKLIFSGNRIRMVNYSDGLGLVNEYGDGLFIKGSGALYRVSGGVKSKI